MSDSVVACIGGVLRRVIAYPQLWPNQVVLVGRIGIGAEQSAPKKWPVKPISGLKPGIGPESTGVRILGCTVASDINIYEVVCSC